MRKVLLQMRRVSPMPRWRSDETLQRTKRSQVRSFEENASNANVGYMLRRREKREECERRWKSFYDSSAAVSEVARRNKTDFHDGIMPGRNMCIGSLRAR